MNQPNPFAAPKTNVELKPDKILLEVRPTFVQNALLVAASSPYLCAAFFLLREIFLRPLTWLTVLPFFFGGVCAIMGLFSLVMVFESRTYSSDGIRMTNWFTTIIKWEEIISWHIKNKRTIQIELRDKSKRSLNGIGSKNHNAKIVEILNQFVGGPEEV